MTDVHLVDLPMHTVPWLIRIYLAWAVLSGRKVSFTVRNCTVTQAAGESGMRWRN